MLDHQALRAFAKDPHLIETDEQLATLRSHVADCQECATLLGRALEFDVHVVGPLRKTWDHLATRRLKALKATGFVPTAASAISVDQWHVLVCPACRRQYDQLSETKQPDVLGRWVTLAVGGTLVVIIGIIGARVLQPRPTPPAPFRSQRALILTSPTDGAMVSVWEQFSWQATGIDGPCTIAFTPSASGRSLIRSVNQSPYVLTRDDSSQLTIGSHYTWTIRCTFTDEAGRKEEIEAPSRHIDFTGEPSTTAPPKSAVSPDALERAREGAGDDEKRLSAVEDQALAALTALDKTLAPEDSAWLWKILGDISLQLDRKADSLTRYESALAIWSQSHLVHDLLYARLVINYAQALQLAGQLDASLRAYLDALDSLRRQPPDAAVMRAYSTAELDLGTLYRERGIPTAAKGAYEKALEIDRVLQDDGRVADDLTDLGNVLVDELDSMSDGLPLLREAADIQRRLAARGKRQVTFGDTLDSLATAYTLAGNAADALPLYNETLALDRKSSDADRVLQTQTNIAELYLDLLEDPTTALARFEEALTTAGHIAQPDPDNTWRVFTGLGRSLVKLGRLDEAEVYIRKAIAIVDGLRGALSDSQSRRHFGSDRGLPYFDLAMLEFQRHRPSEVFRAIEGGRAIGLREIADSGAVEPVVDLTTFQQHLDESDSVLSYSLAGPDDPVLLLAISRSSISVYQLDSRRAIERAVSAALKGIKTSNSAESDRSQLMRLSEQLVPPDAWVTLLSHEHQPRRVTISADGSLQNFPFEALEDARTPQNRSGRSLGAIAFVPSLSWWMTRRARPDQPAAHRDALIVADPTVTSSCAAPQSMPTAVTQNPLVELPSSEVEAKAIGRYASSRTLVLSRSSATLASFNAQDLRDYAIVHFATHAVATGRLNTSFLLLSCAVHPEVLTGDDILKLNLERQLVILSACDTSAGRDLGPEGLDSLAYAFLKSGALAVIATRWKIRDDVALQAMSAFYGELTSGKTSVRDAIRRMEETLAESGLPIRDWAAFSVIGVSDFTPVVHPGILVRITRLADNPVALTGTITLLFLAAYALARWRRHR